MKTGPNSDANRIEPLLRVASLSQHYVQQRTFSRTEFAVKAFQDVDLELFSGKTLALVGESGAGKSSLARCIALLERPDSGEIELEGQDLLALDRKALFGIRRRVQMVFQEPASALNPRLTACEIIAEPLAIQREGTQLQQRERALQLMEQVRLDAKWERKLPFEFSGGQRQRLAIARALALKPSVLILDEALSNLDASNQVLILDLLAELQISHSLAYLHISHDLRLVSQFADEVAVMHEGRIVECKKTHDLFDSPEHSYTRELLATVHSVESILLERSA
ncbi:MAG TPA: ATP-binding cassette domain-containing protein [Candidatus Binatus sp.]|jgi:ABC-type glutathione transport system ATPase component|nr:ATP-binding cassette domain-containing protein [Candidatus Binatus sp.]